MMKLALFRAAPLIVSVTRRKYLSAFRKDSVRWAIMIVRFHCNGLSAEES
jgi:hypothetical protein